MAKRNYLIDSSVIIDYLNNYKEAVIFIESLIAVNVSVITQAELLEGSHDKREMTAIQDTISTFSVTYPTKTVFQTAVNYLERYHLKYGILFDDALIAATAVEHNLTLVTTEKKHFKPIKNLKVHCPY